MKEVKKENRSTMRYLLLSVLVVSLVGVMIPSVFGQIGPQYGAHGGDEVAMFFGMGFLMILIFLIVVPTALVILVVIAIKQYRRKKSS